MKKFRISFFVFVLVLSMLLPLTVYGNSADDNDASKEENENAEDAQDDSVEKEYVLVRRIISVGVVVGDTDEALVPSDASSDVLYSMDYSSAVYQVYSDEEGGFFYADSNGKTKIADSMYSDMGAPDLSVLLFTDSESKLKIWNTENQAVIDTDLDALVGVIEGRFSAEYQYAYISFFNWDNETDELYTVNLEDGKTIQITDEDISDVIAVLDDGSVIYTNYDGEVIRSDGSNETLLANGVAGFCYYSAADELLVYYNEEQELISCSPDASDTEKVLAEDVRNIIPVYDMGNQLGWAGMHSPKSRALNAPADALYYSLILYSNSDEELRIVNIADGSTSLFLSDSDVFEGDACFTDIDTAYTIIEDKAAQLTADGDSWKEESLCDAYSLEITDNKLIVAKYGKEIYRIQDAEAVLLTDEYISGRAYAVSSDSNTLVWIDGSTIWCVTEPAAAAEIIAEDASGYAQISLANGKVYYIDNTYALCTISEDGEKETLAEEVNYFLFIMR